MAIQEIAGLLAVGALLAVVGRGMTKMVFGNSRRAGHSGWRGVFYVTMWAHPILAGAVLGLGPWLPAPTYMGEEWLGRVLWYALAGALSSKAYEVVTLILKQKAASR